jgi:hypothetical protein
VTLAPWGAVSQCNVSPITTHPPAMLIALTLTAQLLAVSPDSVLPVPPQGRVKAVEVGDWYARRLTIHRVTSYALLPTFAFQWAAGTQIWDKGTGAPEWARTGHRIGAATVAGMFTVNAVTGAWNLWESRSTSEGRARRYIHTLSMLTASAGFTWAGAKLSKEAEGNPDKRALHRKVALSSMGITVASGVLMKILND